MCDEWMRGLQLLLSAEQFQQLPRNGAFHYDFLDGTGYIVPRPTHFHAMLDLAPMAADEMDGIELGPVRLDNWPSLIELFAGSFARTQPFAGLDDATRRAAAEKCLTRTRSGGDGPWIDGASFTVREDGQLRGAILVTLLPERDPSDWNSYLWLEPPPPDCIERCLGRPHLTWIFVAPGCTGEGLGSYLLAAAVGELLALGYPQLLRTFKNGNDAKALRQLRNGFRLLAYPGSKRRRS